jgi:light-regulated signal transduction histidine kinase (bacteriophytochrome)
MKTNPETISDIYNILDTIPLLVWLSRKETVFFVNKSWLQYTGCPYEAQTGSGWMESIHPDDLPGFTRLYMAALKDKKDFHAECRLRKSDGTYTRFSADVRPRFSEDAGLIGYTGSFTPLAAPGIPVELEAKLAQQEETLKRLNEKLEAKNVAQERNNAELESFTYIASHDLQEPLRKIQSFSKLIMAKDSANLSDSAKDYFSRIMTAAERMQRLIDDLLSYSGTNVSEVSYIDTDLNDVLKEVEQNFQEVIEEKKAVIQSEKLPVLPVIKFQVNQLFTNIIANALKFSRKNAALHINITTALVAAEDINSIEEVRPGKYWKISFEDNGIGFEQQYENRIFELFQRLHGKNEYIGTGIGLAICKKIAHNHNGYITAIGHPGEGSVFNIYLPAEREVLRK